MGIGAWTSPNVYETRSAADGSVIARFEVFFNTSTLVLTSITAYNAQGSGLTEIQVTRPDQTTSTFPLPTSGKKVAVATTDGQGLPITISCFTATISQAQINAQGFTLITDIVTDTVF